MNLEIAEPIVFFQRCPSVVQPLQLIPQKHQQKPNYETEPEALKPTSSPIEGHTVSSVSIGSVFY
jgi:hypothetical protein